MIATLATPTVTSNEDDCDKNLGFWEFLFPIFVASPASEQGLELDFGDARRCKEQNGIFTLLHPQSRSLNFTQRGGKDFRHAHTPPKFPSLSADK